MPSIPSPADTEFPKDDDRPIGLRKALLDFIAEFANWDLSTNKFFLDDEPGSHPVGP